MLIADTSLNVSLDMPILSQLAFYSSHYYIPALKCRHNPRVTVLIGFDCLCLT